MKVMTTTALPRLALRRAVDASFQQQAAAYLAEYLDKISIALADLDEAALWWRPAPGTNSAGNLLVHLAGNLSLWVLKSIGGRPYERHRGAEFTAGPEAGNKDELLARLTEVVGACRDIFTALSDADLALQRDVQGYSMNTLSAVFHAVEHMSYHTGQIVWIAKQALAARGDDVFEFYPHHAGE